MGLTPIRKGNFGELFVFLTCYVNFWFLNTANIWLAIMPKLIMLIFQTKSLHALMCVLLQSPESMAKEEVLCEKWLPEHLSRHSKTQSLLRLINSPPGQAKVHLHLPACIILPLLHNMVYSLFCSFEETFANLLNSELSSVRPNQPSTSPNLTYCLLSRSPTEIQPNSTCLPARWKGTRTRRRALTYSHVTLHQYTHFWKPLPTLKSLSAGLDAEWFLSTFFQMTGSTTSRLKMR